MKTCDIIIPVWNELESTRECVSKIKAHTHYPYRLIIIDNASGPGTGKYLEGLKKDFKDIILIRNNKNLGFVKAVNQGMVASSAEYVCVMNNDAYARENWLKFMIETVESGPGDIGCANPTSNVFGVLEPDGERLKYQELDACRGFCMLIKREVIRKIGLFDEIYGMGYFEEKDFSKKARQAGYISVRVKSAYVYHVDKLSFGKIKERGELFRRNEQIYNKRWGRPVSVGFIAKDGNSLKKRISLIEGLIGKGHRINIFSPAPPAENVLRDHILIKILNTPVFLFDYCVLYKLYKRRKKKPVDILVAEDKKNADFFNKFRSLHNSDIVEADDAVVMRLCDTKSREG